MVERGSAATTSWRDRSLRSGSGSCLQQGGGSPADVRRIRARRGSSNIEVWWPVCNGEHFLTVTGYTNHPGVLGGELHILLQMVGERLPETWGLLYELDDERDVAPGRNACRV
jgi:Immunity protein 7